MTDSRMTDKNLGPDTRRFQQALAAGDAAHPPLDPRRARLRREEAQ